ncbi:PDR/VanB family oxidoreductase [Caballeronia sp. dw_19]|uniref:PDR/VanB family oxidoreductase n=1 Tax=Caballeronia sp. dw_19 TaxID=2719791 RepID=UPI001BD2271D|nr:PDR/VanB family oxidoreductase [Caballeronia sp. dw_19]
MNQLALRVAAIRYEAQRIHTFELRLPEGGELPPFDAGAHVNVHLGNGLARSYSLTNAPSQRDCYVIGVNLDRKSRGGSAYMHDKVRVGDMLTVSPPANNFPLMENAPHSVLIAGGIGITPLRSMVYRLEELNRSWELIYCFRQRHHAAFVEELEALGRSKGRRTRFYFDGDAGGRRFELHGAFDNQPENTHFYCCGPTSMLSAFETAAKGIEPARIHVEHFAGRQASDETATQGGFKVRLAASGRVLDVAPGQSILDVVLGTGVRVSYSCKEGICGSCETRVIDGTPEHLDLVLSERQQQANDRMMICCSRSKSAELVLDL